MTIVHTFKLHLYVLINMYFISRCVALTFPALSLDYVVHFFMYSVAYGIPLGGAIRM